MRVKFNQANIKVWFVSGTCRNFHGVDWIDYDWAVTIHTANDTTYLLNWNNITLIEEVE